MHNSRSIRTLRAANILTLISISLASLGTTARASNLVVNGNFTSTSGTLGAAGGGLNTQGDYTSGASLNSWSISDVSGSSGLALLYVAGNQGNSTTSGDGITLTGRFGNFSLYDPGNVAGSGGAIPNTSPGGGNFVAADGASGYNVAIYQTINGLIAGNAYAVSFWYAAGQQYSFTGNTTEGWQVSLTTAAQLTQVVANGTSILDTPTQAYVAGTGTPGLANGGFQAWAQQTFYFTSSSSSQVLTFLSMGTPSGQPPVDLLSNVVVTATAPEPSSMAIAGIGMASLIGLLRLRKTRI